MADTKQMVYLREGHITGHTVPLHPTVMERWRRGELTRVNPDGSDWEGDPYILPGGIPADTASSAAADDPGPEPVRPKLNASRVEWAAYAVALGACPAEEADTLNRDELVALTTAPEDKPKQAGE